jgi:hypothetical protein
VTVESFGEPMGAADILSSVLSDNLHIPSDDRHQNVAVETYVSHGRYA